MYAVYIVLMYFNPTIEAWMLPRFPSLSHSAATAHQIQLDHVGTSRRIKLDNDLAVASNSDSDVDCASEFRLSLRNMIRGGQVPGTLPVSGWVWYYPALPGQIFLKM